MGYGDRSVGGIAMTACPSREQLWNYLAERTIEADGSEFRAHMDSCPRCRQILAALTENGNLESALERSACDLHGADGSDSSVGFMETWADPSHSAAGPRAEPPAETIDVSLSVANEHRHGPDVGETLDTLRAPWASPASAAKRPKDASSDVRPRPGDEPTVQATIDLASGEPPGIRDDETEMFTAASLCAPGPMPPAPDSLAESHALTLEVVDRSNLTTDYDARLAGEPRNEARGPAAVASGAAIKGPRDYEILGELGRGGMGVVYKARHRRLNRFVALKMIRGAYADEIQVARFRIEAEAVAALRHPNILQIYDIGESEGSPYVALELLEGGSLADRLRGTALAPKQAAEWMVPLVLAMDAAHKAGIVHRDLKSANILFSADGIPKITDFGLAKRLETDEGQTHTGQIMGTPSYMAPEQARGDTKSAGPPADIYSLGAMLYEMLTGRPPFKGISAIETVKQVIEEEPVSPSRVQFRVPRDLETICMKCLQKEARKRYATAKDMADDLNRYLGGEPIKARRTPLHERAVKWTRRHPAMALASTFAVLGAIALLSWGFWYYNNKRTLEREALRHLATVGDETSADLLRASEMISNNDLNNAKVTLTARLAILEQEDKPGLAMYRERAERMLADIEKSLAAEQARMAEAQARAEAEKRYHRFLDLRKEALYRDTQYYGVTQAVSIEQTRQAAEKALRVFAGREDRDNWRLAELPPALTAAQQADVKDRCYELLLILAEAVAGKGPAEVDRALAILDSADHLRPERSRAYYLTKAACLALRNDQEGSQRQLKEAERERPKSAFDYFLTGLQEFKAQGKLDPEAIDDFDVALQYKPDHFWAKCLQAICFIRTSRLEAAKANLNSCIETDPDFAWLYLLRGFASGQLGLKHATVPKDIPERVARAIKSANRELDEAEADFRVAMDKLAARPDADLQYMLFVNRGLIRFQRGRLDQAANDYQQAIRIKQDPYLAYAELAHVYQWQKRPGEAIEQFTRAIAVKHDWPPLYRGRAAVVIEQPDSTRADRERALADLAMAIQYEKPGSETVVLDHTERARLFYRDERYEDALKECEAALRILPQQVAASATADANALEWHVRVLLKLRRYDDAIRSCDRAIAKGKKSAVFYELRGLAEARHSNYAGAIRDYGRALEIRPGDPHLLNDRGWAYLQLDSPKLALADFDAAIAIDSSDANAYCGRGTAHARLGDHRSAVADAHQALRLDKTNPRLTYNAARIYALAAPLASAEPGVNGRSARSLAATYQDTALQLVKAAVEREAPEKRVTFWKEIIQPDPALSAIRRRLTYEEVMATIRKPSA
jgi:tetratricopeptide (TPR) repeat protein/tRNA A-37 threonylcarbamoyl transferase component Bud32